MYGGLEQGIDHVVHNQKIEDIEGLIFCSDATVPDPGIGEGVYIDHYSTLLNCVESRMKPWPDSNCKSK